MCLAVPGRILEITCEEGIARAARVSFGGIVREVNLACTPEAGIDDYVLVHVGFAITRIDEERAARIFETLRELDALDELEPGSSG